MQEEALTRDSSSGLPAGRQRVCLLIRPAELPGGAAYLAGAFLQRSAAEAVRATLPLLDRARAEIRELDVDDLRPRLIETGLEA